MKKITAILVLLFATLISVNAEEVTGETIFNSKCVACHTLKIPKDKSTMKAPPFGKVSAKIKHDLDDNKTAFVAFVEDYIQNPSEEKVKCMPMALKKFGLMPPIGKAMSEEERKTVATWLFDNFDEKWDDANCTGPNCKGNKCGADKKCGSGKCGGDKAKSDSKCGSGKCGGDKAKTDAKCGNGKCGGNKAKTDKKCGSGKCGDDKAKAKTDAKCGSGKCGGK